jgi:hypothetical protein
MEKIKMNYDDWLNELKAAKLLAGWTIDRDDDECLHFSKKEGGAHWMHDFNKKTRSFTFMDGNGKVNLITQTKVNVSDA